MQSRAKKFPIKLKTNCNDALFESTLTDINIKLPVKGQFLIHT